MEQTIYDICYEILAYVTENIRNIVGDNYEKVSSELLKFLTTNSSKYDEIFNQIDSFNFTEDKTQYKRIMMLIIASSSYYLSLYNIKKELNIETSFIVLEELEQLNFKKIIHMFYNWEKCSKIFDYIEDYIEFYDKSYIFHNNCMEEVIRKKKVPIIRNLNPFEMLNFANYLIPEMLLDSEKIIQDFIDIYDSALYYCYEDKNGEASIYEDEEDFLANVIREKIDEKYLEDEKIRFYKYIISNVYEGFITYYSADKLILKKYPMIGNEFLNPQINFERIYDKILNDNQFLFKFIDFFLEINDNMYEDDLIARRLDFKKVGNLEILKKLDPFYEQEENVYSKILEKRYPN